VQQTLVVPQRQRLRLFSQPSCSSVLTSCSRYNDGASEIVPHITKPGTALLVAAYPHVLFTELRGRGLLRTSPVQSSRKVVLPYAGHRVGVHILSVAECVAAMGALFRKPKLFVQGDPCLVVGEDIQLDAREIKPVIGQI
jgi:hypothetical protein